MVRKKWTSEEIEFLKDNFKNFSKQELADKFNVSVKALNSKINRLGLRYGRFDGWEDSKINLLKENHDKMTKDELCELLCVNFNQLRFQLKKMGLKHKKTVELWTEEEKQILINNTHLHTSEVAEILNRSEQSVISAYKKYKISRNFRKIDEWTDSEVNIINSKAMNKNELIDALPNKNYNQIKYYIRKNNLTILELWESVIDDILNVKCFKCGEYKPYDSTNFRINSKSNVYTCRECKKKIQTVYHWKKNYGIHLEFEKGVDTYDVIEWYEFRKKYNFRSYPVDLYKDKNNVIKLGRHILINEFGIKDKYDILAVSVQDFRNYMTDKIIQKHYKNYKDFILNEFTDYGITAEDLELYFLRDGITQCDSMAERSVYHWLEDNYNAQIELIGRERSKKYYDKKFNQCYNPDFIIYSVGEVKLSKPLIVEYFGLFNENSNQEILANYREKTYQKCNYFKDRDDLFFIDVYPRDLKNNYEGLNDKIHKFIESIHIKEVTEYKEK